MLKCQSHPTKLTNNQVFSQHICLLMNNVYNLWSQSLLLVPLHPIFIKMFPFKKPSITALECPFDIIQYKVSKDLHEKTLFSTHFWIRQHIIFGENEWSLKLNRWNTTHKWNVNVNRYVIVSRYPRRERRKLLYDTAEISLVVKFCTCCFECYVILYNLSFFFVTLSVLCYWNFVESYWKA